MSELAYNINGEAFEVPAHATGWRVRRMRAKGSPEVVYSREGTPLVLPIDAELEDLRREVDVTGRYRLDLVDQHNKAIADVPSGYVQVNFDPTPISSNAPTVTTASFAGQSDNIALEAMRMQSMIAVSVVERFPQMMEAAATLLRAADGAGLPARPPMALTEGEGDEDGDDEDGEADKAQQGFDLNALIGQMVPVIVAGFTSGKLKMPDLASMFDWRKAAAKAKPVSEPPAATPMPASHAEPAAAAELPPLDPTAMAHVVAIQSALEPHEVAYIQQVAKELSPGELRGWFDELSKLSVPDAVARVRNLINGKKGGAS